MLDTIITAYRTIETQNGKVIRVENELQNIYRNFMFKSPQEKEDNLNRFIELLEEREEVQYKAGEAFEILQQNINNLNIAKNGFFDKMMYKRRIKEMEKILKNSDIEVDAVEEITEERKTNMQLINKQKYNE